ncbi:hypothetical protein LMG19083_01988 [Ralstonia psammae]|uniref:Transmembrane protein n=1 Tax=Ralstonia psammae TaxID=3058598 RepID=A0ABM9JDP3_9RALS|nr:hypothetical protein [Ralstonia sp. LMG 19083]CAJ0790324.1 hypothetical protein LMG19083_01988 [Ralstonia sp. LMG 19083]
MRASTKGLLSALLGLLLIAVGLVAFLFLVSGVSQGMRAGGGWGALLIPLVMGLVMLVTGVVTWFSGRSADKSDKSPEMKTPHEKTRRRGR